MSDIQDIERLYCSAGDCLEEAIVSGHAVFQVNPLAGAMGGESFHTFVLPLCPHHAYLLRMENRLVSFDCGLAFPRPK